MIKNLKNKKKKGFTLIELIIVIAIIAILAAVAVPKFGEVRTNANKKTDIANAKTIHSAVTTLLAEEKFSNNTTLPTFEIVEDDKQGTKSSGEIVGEYLQTVPKGKLEDCKGNSFYVKVTAGTVTVSIKDKDDAEIQIYPEPSSPSTSNVYYK